MMCMLCGSTYNYTEWVGAVWVVDVRVCLEIGIFA
jgi:RNA polymerase subunit RPABC4/transcription elongation factor Spt4